MLKRCLILILAFVAQPAFAENDDPQNYFRPGGLDQKLGVNGTSDQLLDTRNGEAVFVESGMTNLTKLVIAVCVFIGFILCGKALWEMYSLPKQNQNIGKAFVTLVVGALFAILPWVVFTSSATLQQFFRTSA